MYKNILIPTDGSPLARSAIEAGVALAAKVGARVTGFYAAPAATPLVYRNLLPVRYDTTAHNEAVIARAARAHLDVVARAAKAARVKCDCVSVTSDFPADAILAAAKKHRCDLIVIAPHGRKGLSALLLGSQTQKVLAHAKVPVLVHR